MPALTDERADMSTATHPNASAGAAAHAARNPAEPRSGASVLVLGANGRLGRAATLAFAAAGWRVCAQVRRAPRAPLPASVQTLVCDALDAATLRPAARGAAVIVHALSPDYAHWDRLLPPLTKAVTALAADSGATLMLPGNVYNFGNALPPRLTEHTPFVASHPKAAQRIALEAALADAAGTHGMRSIVLRAGDFIGDTGTWIDLALAKGIARGRFTHMGPADLPHAWAWLPDLARVFVALAERREAVAASFGDHAVLHYAGLTLSGAELQAAFERVLGRPLRRAHFPWPLLRLGAPFSPLLRTLVEMRYLWQRPHQLDDARLRSLLGTLPTTPLDDVVRGALGRPAGLIEELSAAH